jgi:hypothetical protein
MYFSTALHNVANSTPCGVLKPGFRIQNANNYQTLEHERLIEEMPGYERLTVFK